MGRNSRKTDRLDGEVPIFAAGDLPLAEKPASTHPLAIRAAAAERAPPQTDAKSRLIAEYLSRFQLVTKGGLYIDGFAAPQKRDRLDAWTARRVLEIVPKRLRTFWLCDNDPAGCIQLRGLRERHHGKPSFRRVFVMEGDFNKRVTDIIRSGRIKQRTPVFALLDQRNMECEWSTVQKLAAYKGRTRIELLYFLGTSWLFRPLKLSRRPEAIARIDRWWGSPEWRNLADLSQLLLQIAVADRFQKELGYRYSNPYPIFMHEEGQKKAFVLIHATDHPAAPKLMQAAYNSIYPDRAGSPSDSQKALFEELPTTAEKRMRGD